MHMHIFERNIFGNGGKKDVHVKWEGQKTIISTYVQPKILYSMPK